jgi:mono/diheme cytochrome c family protein
MSMKRYSLYLLVGACMVLYGIAAFGYQSPAAPNAAGQLTSRYCVSCHNQRLKSGNLALDTLNTTNIASSAETWEKVIVKLRSRSMPPPGAPRPDAATYDSVAGWLESEIDRVAAAKVNPGRSVSLHRLNRAEYANVIRDLLGMDVDPQALLPPDEQAFGFENNGEALSMQPALLDRYVSAAASIARQAVGDPNIPATFVRYGAIKNNANDLTYLRPRVTTSRSTASTSSG